MQWCYGFLETAQKSLWNQNQRQASVWGLFACQWYGNEMVQVQLLTDAMGNACSRQYLETTLAIRELQNNYSAKKYLQ